MARRPLVFALAASALLVAADAFFAPPPPSLLHPSGRRVPLDGFALHTTRRVPSNLLAGRSHALRAPRGGVPQRMAASAAAGAGVAAENLKVEAASAQAFAPIAWRKHWYPVAVEKYTTKDKPFAFTLMGTALVIWYDFVAQEWRAVSDRCPHRLAPLSEGRINAAGHVECPYHGWAFEGENGKCSSMPQKPTGEAMPAKACVSSFATAAKVCA